MTRNDYEQIALALARSRDDDADWYVNEQWIKCRQEIMFVLAKDNPRFDIEKFEAATMENLG